MAKSAENFLTLENAFIKKNINPLAFRFAALQVHYRKPMEYSEEIMRNADIGLKHLYNQVRELGKTPGAIIKSIQRQFIEAINDDLNIPKSLAVIQELLKSKLSNSNKLATVLDFDKILGLNLRTVGAIHKLPISERIKKLIDARQKARKEKNYKESDRIRSEIENKGYIVEDTENGQRVYKKSV